MFLCRATHRSGKSSVASVKIFFRKPVDFTGPKRFHFQTLKYFNASVVCFGHGHRAIYNSQLAALDIHFRELCKSIVGLPVLDWNVAWREGVHVWNELVRSFVATARAITWSITSRKYRNWAKHVAGLPAHRWAERSFSWHLVGVRRAGRPQSSLKRKSIRPCVRTKRDFVRNTEMRKRPEIRRGFWCRRYVNGTYLQTAQHNKSNRTICKKKGANKQTNKQPSKQPSKQTNKQPNKQLNKQASKQTNKQTTKQTNN